MPTDTNTTYALIREFTNGLAFWEELYQIEKKRNIELCRTCANRITELENEFDSANDDWLNLDAETEERMRDNVKQQQLLQELMERFGLVHQVVDNLANNYLRHSAAQADASDIRLTWLYEAIQKKDAELEELNKMLDCYKEVHTDLLRAYNELYEQVVTKNN